MSIFYALTLIKRTIAAYPVAQGNILQNLITERYIMQNSEKNQTPENIIRIVDLVAAIFQRIKQKSLDKSAEKSLCM